MLRRRNWILAAGIGLLAASAVRAELFSDTWGQPRGYRWNDQRTGFGFDPTDPAFKGLPSNQMPSLAFTRKDLKGTEYKAMTPDLLWIYPFDVEGRSLDDPGNKYPLGYFLGEMHSSPTVAGVETATNYTLSVMFGSSTTVDRSIRNPLPPQLNYRSPSLPTSCGADDTSTGRAGEFTTLGVYNADLDPYSYLHNQKTGAVFSLDAMSGTTTPLDISLGYSDFERNYQPLWWWGVRNLPYYTACDQDPISTSDTRTFENSPSLAASQFFINVSDSLVRAFDYSTSEARAVKAAAGEQKYGPEQADSGDFYKQPKNRREAIYSRYLKPSVAATKGKDSGPGIDSGAGRVALGRPDIPERITDRLYNLSIDGERFGLAANADNITGSGPQSLGRTKEGPLDNRFRQLNGMGPINSTGVFVNLGANGTDSVSYRSRYYAYTKDLKKVRDDRRDPEAVVTESGLTTNQLYIVGSDDGYVYAFDARPDNARRVSGGSDNTTTWVGRLVWAFRAAARAPMFHTGDSKGDPLTVEVTAPGESPGTAVQNADGYVHLEDGSLVSPSATVITGPIVSNPVVCEVQLDGSAFSHPNQTRKVVLFGSGMGRLFCLDAATGLEEWEFKTTPVGQSQIRLSDNSVVNVDSVAGQPILTSPTLGFVAGAASQARPVVSGGGRLAVFFGADDGKVYSLDVGDGTPIRDGSNAGWDVATQQKLGTVATNDRALLDHYGFVVYPFERGSDNLPDTRIEKGGSYGRTTPSQWGGKRLTASVVARPATPHDSVADPLNPGMPTVDMIFISSPTNQADAATANEPSFSGGTIWAVNPRTGGVMWTFDRFHDVTRTVNTDFDKDTSKDYTIRPYSFNVTPAYASGIQIFDDSQSSTAGGYEGEKNPLTNVNVLFAIDSAGRMFALKTDTGLASVDRLYWRAPYPLTSSGVGNSGNVYSTPVVTSPDSNTGNDNDNGITIDGRSWVYVGTSDGLIAIDTTAMRTAPLVDAKTNLLPAATRYTGGELTWGWTTPRETLALSNATGTGSSAYDIVTTPCPVVTTPAIHDGLVFAGSDSGLMYAWAHQEDVFGSGYGLGYFGNTGGGGRGRYTGRNRPRVPLPPDVRPPGGGVTTSTSELFVDIFQAGFDTTGSFGFTSPQQAPTAPSGGPAGNKGNLPLTSPAPVGAGVPDFQETNGGVLEWGDGVFVQAWGPALANATPYSSSSDPNNYDKVVFQLTGASTSGSLKATVEGSGSSHYSRQIFYLDPFTRRTPDSLLYPNRPRGEVINPLYGQMLRPGDIAPHFTVTAYYQPADVSLQLQAGADPVVTKQPMQRATINAVTKFRLANPINVSGYFDDGAGFIVPNAKGAALSAYPDGVRNGNLERVPVVPSVIGDHGVDSRPTTINTVDHGAMKVQDRSNFYDLRQLANRISANSGDDIALKVKVQTARMRWVGGPSAAYKPLFHGDGNAFRNTWPLATAPEPMWTTPTEWTDRYAAFYDRSVRFWGSEQPPYFDGEENKSQDYPDIPANRATWIKLPQSNREVETDATNTEAAINNVATMYLRVAVPKYQPANYAPLNVQVNGTPGVGPGYYTINPANQSSPKAAIMGWNPVSGSGKGSYLASTTGGQYYKAPFDPPGTYSLQASNAYTAQETQYLSKVYADINGNGSADVDAGEAYRMFVTGAQVRPAESMRVTTPTIDLPRGPETAIPGGYIPFQFYFDKQAQVAGGTPTDADKFLYGQRNFYSPFSVYNIGNVNLWDVRVDKYDPFAGHLDAPSIDENYLFGAEQSSNWPASGLLKRTNLASTLDALPIASGPGSAADFSLFSPARKPRPGTFGDEGQGQAMALRDVFQFTGVTRKHANNGSTTALDTQAGNPYLTIAVPPGTSPGRYSTRQGRFIVFEDSGGIYGNGRAYNGVLDLDNNGSPLESGITSDAQVTVNVSETRLTNKVSQLEPFLPNADTGVAFASRFSGTPGDKDALAKIWATLAQDTTPAAYRDPITGDLVSFWSSNRRQVGATPISGLPTPDEPTDMYRVFGTMMKWNDPVNPPVKNTADLDAFLGSIRSNPWGWDYYGGRTGDNFFFPNFGSARWFGEPTVSPWMPSEATVNSALGAAAGTYQPADLNYTSPGVITNFYGTKFPPVVFWTGQVGTGAETRSAIFYAPVQVNRDSGEVTTTAANIQAVGVLNGKRTLDPFTPKYQPRPFLITAGGTLTETGALMPTAWLNGQQVIGLGVVWFGGAPGAWKLYVSTIKTNDSGEIANDAEWKTVQLALPGGVVSAMQPSVYYHQWPQTLKDADGKGYKQGTIEVAFTGYSRSGRNPDIYITRYIAMTHPDGGDPAISGTFPSMGFARKGGDPRDKGNKPLEPLIRVAGEPRPVYRSHWVNWLGRRNLGTVVYWFQKPTQSTSNRDYRLLASFTLRNPGGASGNVVELHADNGAVPPISVFVNAASGTVRFATTDPVNAPAPMTRPHIYDGTEVQDYIYVAMNPYALRVTVDDAAANSQPQIWLDESHEVLGPDRQADTNFDVSASNPLQYRRDRLWVLWRRGAAPEGATKQSSLFFTTYRLGVDVGQDPSAPAGQQASVLINTRNNKPDVQILDASGAAVDTVFVVDRNRGRIFFTEANDGDQVQVVVNGTNRGLFTIGWVQENTRNAAYYGTDAGGNFRLPSMEATEPLAVPTQGQGNDAMPWMFKDPWSNIPVQDDAYYARANNSMWLFWSSTRPSRAYGGEKSAPGLTNDKDQVDPFYYSGTNLMYSGSASDVYYTTLSPDFTK